MSNIGTETKFNPPEKWSVHRLDWCIWSVVSKLLHRTVC
jgi:hypothetical protein